MNDELRDYLDGEGGRESLSGASRAEAEAWDRLFATLREESPGAAPGWLEGRIMAEVRDVAEKPGRGFWAWLRRPLQVRMSPLALAGAVAALAALVVWPWVSVGPAPGGDQAVGTGSGDAVVYIQFVLEAPDVSSVAVAGDFNGWDAGQRLDDPDGDGVWTGRVAVSPGVHEYMFIVNGDDWVTDPRAERYVDDGFGNRNAVLTVSSPGAT